MKNIKQILLSLLLLGSLALQAQQNVILKALDVRYRLGGSGAERPASVQQTTDGGYIVAGFTASSASGDVSGTNNGGNDVWVVKLDAWGAVTWEKNYGGSGSDVCQSIQQTADGGYILAGTTGSSASGDISGTSKGGNDVWVVKLNASGAITWEKNYGGSGSDMAYSVQQTADGGYIVAGTTGSSASGDVSGTSKGSNDFWVLKLNASGVITWQKNYGGNLPDTATSIQQTTDGGYIVAGYTQSSASGDVSGTNNGPFDYWVVKLNASGVITWQKLYGGSGDEQNPSIQQTADGGYIMTGFTSSSASGDVSGTNNGNYDLWVVKLNASGVITWQKNYGGSGDDRATSIQQTADGGYIVGGTTASSASGDVSGTSKGSYDYWVVKLNASGAITWEKNYGGNDTDFAYSIQQTASGGYVVAGSSGNSSAGNGDQGGLISQGNSDLWVLILDASGNIIQ